MIFPATCSTRAGRVESISPKVPALAGNQRGAQIRQARIRIAEISVVEEVERLGSELEVGFFREREVLAQAHVDIPVVVSAN